MNFINAVLERARERILALEITNTGMLTDFLEESATIDLEITSREMSDAAIDRGLYRFMGKQYQLGLDYIIGLAREAIAHGLIADEFDLHNFLARKVPAIANGIDVDKVFMDLQIDARQGGLYEQFPAQVEEAQPSSRQPAAVS